MLQRRNRLCRWDPPDSILVRRIQPIAEVAGSGRGGVAHSRTFRFSVRHEGLGLRVSEIAALQWDDFDLEKNQLLVQRSFVSGHVDDVKTGYSRDYVPLHESLVEVLLE